MSKHIQAYFKTESEAEGARMSLMTFSTEQLEVGELQGAVGGRRETGRVIVPLVPLGGMTTAGYAGGAGVAGGAAGAIGDHAVPVPAPSQTSATGSQPIDKDDVDETYEDASSADLRDLKYTLSAKVREEDYEAVVRKLRNNNGYVHYYD